MLTILGYVNIQKNMFQWQKYENIQTGKGMSVSYAVNCAFIYL